MTVIDKEGEICDMDKKETFGGEIAKSILISKVLSLLKLQIRFLFLI